MTTDFMAYVDKGHFADLFQDLGWDLPPGSLSPVEVETDDGVLTARPVADQSGLRVWVCETDLLPGASVQREVDNAVSKLSQVRLLIFTDGVHQSWRWPRRGATAATNTKLLQHSYTVGNEEQYDDLARRLSQIELPLDEHIGITDIQERMAQAFNDEAVKRSTEASRHMESMNQILLDAGCSSDTASSLLVRLLFLFFGDDTQMWPEDTFQKWVLHHTIAENFHAKLTELFDVLCDEELDQAQVSGGHRGHQRSGICAGSEFEDFRRIDGMYREHVELPVLPGDFRQQVLTAGEFDWGKINPDIFGAMFQQLVDPEELREQGEHYTSEENIQKVIEPLFLDHYQQKLNDVYDDRKALLALQTELSGLQFIDPACGSGNFLIQAYKHLRGLEYELIARAEELELAEIQQHLTEIEDQRMSKTKKKLVARRDEIQAGNSLQFDEQVLRKSKLTMRQFYGIEINAWPAKVASTAMLLVDHLCNQAWGENVVRLPVEETPEIVCDNALRADWEQVVPDNGNPTYVFGNPPFIGQYTKSDDQTADMKAVWGNNYDGYLDYVTAWHAKSLQLLEQREGMFAFVTTNSIAQGQPVPALFGPIFDAGWRIRFAHRTFAWDSEAPGKAAVHCVIVGFDRQKEPQPRLWDYPQVKGEPVPVTVEQEINAYLVDGPNVLISKRMSPLSPELPECNRGTQPTDDGHLIVEINEIDEVRADPIAAKYLRRFVGSRELIRGLKRWCLWLEDASTEDIHDSPVIHKRVEATKQYREQASRKGDAYKLRNIPHLFRPNSVRPTTDYLCIPSVVSETRQYFTALQVPGEMIASNLAFTVEDPSGLSFSLISSSMFITWQRTVGGRMKSDLRFASTLTWHTFPVPDLGDIAQEKIIQAGQGVLAARELYPGRSLAEHYNPLGMDPALLKAHEALDHEVDKAFGAPQKLSNERQRQELLFERYSEIGATERSRRS